MENTLAEIDLSPFCSTDESRPVLTKPFSDEDYTYATNGAFIVRVAKRLGFDQALPSLRSSVAAVFSSLPANQDERFVFPPEIPMDVRQCGECGAEKRVPKYRVAVGSRDFDGKYLAKISELPNAKVAPSVGGASDAMPFTFEGGDGMVMPMAVIRPA